MIRFPVWRELKLCFNRGGRCSVKNILWYAFPFEGNWNLCLLTWFLSKCKPLVIRFPVWRELKHKMAKKLVVPFKLVIRFPVWRELKPLQHPDTERETRNTCDTLSRLKGIETFVLFFFFHSIFGLVIRFPVWRELKPKLWWIKKTEFSIPCDTLSRLKGIETFNKRVLTNVP